MIELESLQEYFQLRTRQYIKTLGKRDLDIIETFPRDHFLHQLALLVSRRAGEGELDVFCGYCNDGEKIRAIFFSLHPGTPIVPLEMHEVRERVENMARQGLSFDQSLQALSEWPG